MASRLVFVDTAAWVARFDKRDHYHEAATGTFAALSEAGRLFITTDFVMDETVTHLRKAASLRAALIAWTALEEAGLAQLVKVELLHRNEGRKLMEKFGNLVLSMTDCTSFAIMRELGISEALTFDDDFTKAGFIRLPRRKRG